jgi:hypothetical protein
MEGTKVLREGNGKSESCRILRVRGCEKRWCWRMIRNFGCYHIDTRKLSPIITFAPKWWNWQTRQLEVLVRVSACRFKSGLRQIAGSNFF